MEFTAFLTLISIERSKKLFSHNLVPKTAHEGEPEVCLN